jgi:hypothetical protein
VVATGTPEDVVEVKESLRATRAVFEGAAGAVGGVTREVAE